jgi:hypothetical protein
MGVGADAPGRLPGIGVPAPTGSVRFAPQAPQNLALAGFACPHAEQDTGNGAPHSMQKRLPSGISALQRSHRMPVPSTRAITHQVTALFRR